MSRFVELIATALVLWTFTYFVYNAVIPNVFGLNKIDYWQAVLLYILSNLLFKDPIGMGKLIQEIQKLK